MLVTLRTHNIDGIGSFGKLTLDGKVVAYTCEREWLDNKPQVSCVPAGTYRLVPHQSPKVGLCYALENPELGVTIFGPSKRSHILIHAANFPHELEGCIAPGIGWHGSGWGVRESRRALFKLNELLGLQQDREHVLTIERSL
ncbi:MAG: DUF5675 family protein [Aeromonas allosaccharophila]